MKSVPIGAAEATDKKNKQQEISEKSLPRR